MDAGDELSTADSSFASDLGDPFSAWFNGGVMTPNPDTGSSIDLAARLNFSDSPIIHASEMDDTDNILGSVIDTNTWQRQASGVGLGISLNAGSNGKLRDDAAVNDLFFQFMRDDASSGEWNLEEFANAKARFQLAESDDEDRLTCPPASQSEMESRGSGSQATEDELVPTQMSAPNPYATPDQMMSPPLKRRRTALV
jgi:hypothetical protein